MDNLDLSKVKKSRNDLKRKLKLPTKLTPQLAEDLGIMVGDGSINIYQRNKRATDYMISCYGNSKNEREYLEKYVKSLKQELYNLHFVYSEQRKNTCRLLTRSKGLLEFYTKVIGLPRGAKKNINIPKIVFDSDRLIKYAFLRGLADTDFALTFKKRNKKVFYYPTIKISTCSKKLVIDLSNLLLDLDFKPSVCYNMRYIHPKTRKKFTTHQLNLYGEDMLNKWVENIGFRNPKYIQKYKMWKTKGFVKIIKRALRDSNSQPFG